MKNYLILIITAAALLAATQAARGAEYYVDFIGGNDALDGVSSSAAWQHAPGDANALGNPATVTLVPGDIVLFKKGVTYDGRINVPSSGSKITEGSSGTVNSSGDLTDNSGNFGNVMAGDYVYIYHSLASGNEIESTGLWQVKSVNSQTSLTLADFNGLFYSIPELSYKIYRTITYTSDPSYGNGEAVITGAGIRDIIFDIHGGKKGIRIANLSLTNTRDPGADNCSGNTSGGAVVNTLQSPSPHAEGIIVENLNISNVWSGILGDFEDYIVFRGNTIKHFGHYGINGTRYALIENNYMEDGLGGIRNSMEYSVLRFNTLIDMIGRPGTGKDCGSHADAIGPIFSGSSNPGGNKHGWIYSNWIQNSVQGIYLTYTNQGTDHWTIANNVLIGSLGYTGTGALAIGANAAPNVRIYNNTILGLNDQEGWINAIWIGPNAPYSVNAEVKNNIIYNGQSIQAMAAISVNSGFDTFVSEGNFFYYPKISATTQFLKAGSNTYTLSQWLKLGYDNAGYSLATNPLFIDPVGITKNDLDLRLQANSPAQNSPYSLPNNLRDIAGMMRFAGQPWDRGAYEFVSLEDDLSGDGRVSAYDAALALQLGRGELEAAGIAQQAVELL